MEGMELGQDNRGISLPELRLFDLLGRTILAELRLLEQLGQLHVWVVRAREADARRGRAKLESNQPVDGGTNV